MDVYYLAIAYLATMRNWQNLPATGSAGSSTSTDWSAWCVFELTQVRALLLVFPNTFEYFFIAYEAIRIRWSPVAADLRRWSCVAGVIWIFIKLPQEYWIHVAQLDFTDTLASTRGPGRY